MSFSLPSLKYQQVDTQNEALIPSVNQRIEDTENKMRRYFVECDQRWVGLIRSRQHVQSTACVNSSLFVPFD